MANRFGFTNPSSANDHSEPPPSPRQGKAQGPFSEEQKYPFGIYSQPQDSLTPS